MNTGALVRKVFWLTDALPVCHLECMRKLLFPLLLWFASVARGAFTLPPNSLVLNGGFENGWVSWGWTYNIGIFGGFSSAAEGRNWGTIDGTAYQDLNTTPGLEYHLEFAMAGNFNFPSNAVMNIYWGGSEVRSLEWSPVGHNIDNLGWEWCDLDLTASDPITRLLFENPAVGTQNIPYLDAVSVVLVPEPCGVALLGVAICCMARRLTRQAR